MQVLRLPLTTQVKMEKIIKKIVNTHSISTSITTYYSYLYTN